MKLQTLAIIGLLFTVGCVGTKPLKGGRATTVAKPAGVIEQTVVQGENPAQQSRQDQETIKTRSYTVPAGSEMVETATTMNDSGVAVTNAQSLVVSGPMLVFERQETRAKTELGAAQKDAAREIGAKLSSLKGIVWLGAALFLFGLASFFYPPLKAVIGSVTTSAAILLGGLTLMVLPSMIVGNELLILGGVAVGVGAWFLAHRHGQLRGMLGSDQAPRKRLDEAGRG